MREMTINRKLINRLSMECFDAEPTESEILTIMETFNAQLEDCGGILYENDLCEIIGDIVLR